VSVERNAQALIDLVRDAAAARRAELVTKAQSEASAILREALGEARRAARRALDDARRRGRERLGAARAMLETRQRLALHRRHAALLAAGWQALPAALVARWQRETTRSLWIEATLAAARRSLPKGGWRVVHPADWPKPEREAIGAAILRDTGVAPELGDDGTIRAGIALAAAGTRIDATLSGLLSDRADIEAALLELLEDDAAQPAVAAIAGDAA
jgi:hypothetical protein